MRKLIILLSAVSCLALVGCGSEEQENVDHAPGVTPGATSNTPGPNTNKTMPEQSGPSGMSSQPMKAPGK